MARPIPTQASRPESFNVRLRYDNDVTTLQVDVALELAAPHDVVIRELQRLFTAVGEAPQHDDLTGVGEGGQSARHAQRLHDVHAGVDDELPGFVDLADDVDLVALDLLNGDGDHRVSDVLAEAFGHDGVELRDGFAAGIHLTRQREREHAIGAHQHRPLQIRLLPDGDRQQVAWLDGVG